MAKTADEYAIEIQTKFELYLIALTFTILGLAIQTAKFSAPPLDVAASIATLCELLGWASLLASGVQGLHRFQYVSPMQWWLHKMHRGQQARDQAAALPPQTVVRTQQGEQLARDVAKNWAEKLPQLDAEWDKRNENMQTMYSRHLWLLYAGLALLAVGRGLEPASHLWSALWTAWGR